MNKSEESPWLAMETNAWPLNPCPSLFGGGAKLMTLSSDYVFDGTRTEGYNEEDAPNPQTWYGKSKLAGEWMARAYCKRLLWCAFRAFMAFGSQGKKLNFVDLMLKLSKERENSRWTNAGWLRLDYALAKNMIALIETDLFGLYHMSL